jgi:biotin carboxyl carrier protein
VTHDVDPAGGPGDPRPAGAPAADARTPDERRADHAAIDRLADELLPALVAKLGASGLGELDVREGAWRVRLRMPADGRGPRRAAGRTGSRSESRTDGRPDGHVPAGLAGSAAASAIPPRGATREAAAAGATDDASPDAAPTRATATAPAVGFFRPLPALVAGARVRAGDRLGAIDVLGVPHEVVAPVDGIVGASLAAAGDPVEYGQGIVEIELLVAPAAERGEGA